MLQRLMIVGLLFATTGVVFADSSHHSQRKIYKGAYKGENTHYLPPAAVTVPAPQPVHFSFGAGPYVGLSLGIRDNYTSMPVNYKGIEGTLTAGFGALLKNGFYIAEEVFVGDGFEVQNYAGNAANAKSSWGVGLSVLPGYLILDNLMGYLRLGVVKTYFSSASTSNNGGQVGLGFESALTENWDLRGEYVYSFYQTTQNCSSEEGRLGAVKSDQFNVGLIYKFG